MRQPEFDTLSIDEKMTKFQKLSINNPPCDRNEKNFTYLRESPKEKAVSL
jgi:hypothetical protein